MVEAQCERLRMLYRDCARPPPPPLQTDRRQVVFFLFPFKQTKSNKKHNLDAFAIHFNQ